LGLEKLKSIFTEDIQGLVELYEANQPQGIDDSKLGFDPDGDNQWDPITIHSTHYSAGGTMTTSISAPIAYSKPYDQQSLDTLLREPPAFISDDLNTKFYMDEAFDPRTPKNINIEITKNTYNGSALMPGGVLNNMDTVTGVNRFDISSYQFFNTDFSSAGTDDTSFTSLGMLGRSLYIAEDSKLNQSWQNLYNADHTNKGESEWNGIVPISYPNSSRGKLDIRDQQNSFMSSGFSLSRGAYLGAEPEPYIVSHIPTGHLLSGGRFTNSGNRSIPIGRVITDTARLAKFMTSAAGLAFIAKQNLLGLNSKVETPLLTLWGEQPSTLVAPQLYSTFYNPLSTLGSALTRIGDQSTVKIRRDELLPSFLMRYPGYSMKDINRSFGGYSEIINLSTSWPIAAGVKISNPLKKIFGQGVGDKMTLAPMRIGDSIGSGGWDTWAIGRELENPIFQTNFGSNLESAKNGMPLYFKDMRDSSYIFFRAYLEGLVETITPTWTASNYIGRSEPAYVYERGERELSFTLKLMAQTRDELNMIYKKMNKLTSLCYPEYKEEASTYTGPFVDPVTNQFKNTRMKPPLTKLRLGELYGKTNDELLGFIKGISYTVDQTSQWETQKGARVPKYILATLTYQVIHSKVPQLDTEFYGFNGNPVIPGSF